MDEFAENEEIEANELLDETQRLRHKRDLLTKENEQLKSYLRLRQMESTATCEQLKSEIEQQIEQFEALGDTQTNHLETLKSFRAEIEAIQAWNQKIRNKYFSRNSSVSLSPNHNYFAPNQSEGKDDELTVDRGADQVLVSSSSSLRKQDSNRANHSKSLDTDLIDSNSKDIDCDNKESIDSKISYKSKRKARSLEKLNVADDLPSDKNDNKYNIITRSKQKLLSNCSKRKNFNSNEKKTKRKRK